MDLATLLDLDDFDDELPPMPFASLAGRITGTLMLIIGAALAAAGVRRLDNTAPPIEPPKKKCKRGIFGSTYNARNVATLPAAEILHQGIDSFGLVEPATRNNLVNAAFKCPKAAREDFKARMGAYPPPTPAPRKPIRPDEFANPATVRSMHYVPDGGHHAGQPCWCSTHPKICPVHGSTAPPAEAAAYLTTETTDHENGIFLLPAIDNISGLPGFHVAVFASLKTATHPRAVSIITGPAGSLFTDPLVGNYPLQFWAHRVLNNTPRLQKSAEAHIAHCLDIPLGEPPFVSIRRALAAETMHPSVSSLWENNLARFLYDNHMPVADLDNALGPYLWLARFVPCPSLNTGIDLNVTQQAALAGVIFAGPEHTLLSTIVAQTKHLVNTTVADIVAERANIPTTMVAQCAALVAGAPTHAIALSPEAQHAIMPVMPPPSPQDIALVAAAAQAAQAAAATRTATRSAPL
jgi:hypothetical protein